MKKNYIIIAVVVLIVAAIGFRLVSNKHKIDAGKKVVDRSNTPVAVGVFTVEQKALAGKFQLPATLDPIHQANISVPVQGKIVSLNIELGSHVSKGQTIGNIDTRVKEFDLKAKELSLQKMEKDYQRNKELFQANAGTEVNYTDAEYNYENTKVQAEQIRRQIADGSIISPISGVIDTKKLEVGEFTNIGTIIASVVDISQLKAIVYVSERDVYQLKKGQSAVITSDVFPGKAFPGKIAFISPRGDDNHNYRVEVVVSNQTSAQLRAGTYVIVEFSLDRKGSVLQIPKSALVEGLKNPYVYISKDGKAVSRKLIIGRELGENVEVISGLQAGEEVVLSGQINLIDGSKIEVVK